MITTTIFLNGRVAFRTLFCMSGNPIGSLRIVLTFLEPHAGKRTNTRLMISKATAETELIGAVAFDGGYDLGELHGSNGTSDSVVTVWSGTPAHGFDIIDVGANE